MISSRDRLYETFSFLSHSETDIVDKIISSAFFKQISKGKFIFLEGDECQSLAMIFSGVIRIYKIGETGREITLYRVSKGESCILTASCVLSQQKFPANAIVEEEVEAAIIPARIVREWINRYEDWRIYIFGLISKRFSEILTTVEEVAFHRMDTRIAEILVNSAQNHQLTIKMTHHNISLELGTSREVVSRILKYFERENLISLKRKEIIVHDLKGLKDKIK